MNELQAQAEILVDLGALRADHPLHARLDRNGRALSGLIAHLRAR